MAKPLKTLRFLGEKVAEFHTAFLIGNKRNPDLLSLQEATLRYTLMREENEEYLEACRKEDLEGIADALGDQLYVLLGTALRHGLMERLDTIFLEIHRSNMSKLDAQGRPIFREDGKVLKSKGWSPPNLAPLLKEPGDDEPSHG